MVFYFSSLPDVILCNEAHIEIITLYRQLLCQYLGAKSHTNSGYFQFNLLHLKDKSQFAYATHFYQPFPKLSSALNQLTSFVYLNTIRKIVHFRILVSTLAKQKPIISTIGNQFLIYVPLNCPNFNKFRRIMQNVIRAFYNKFSAKLTLKRFSNYYFCAMMTVMIR